MTPLQKISVSLFLLFSTAGAWACYDPAGSGQCGPNGIGPRNPGFGYNTYVEPAPVYRPPPPPPTHDCVASEGGKTCFDTRPGRIGSSYSTDDAGEFDGPMVESYPDGTPKSIATYRNGKAEGESTFFSPDGTIESVMHYQNGELHGSVQHFHPNGALRSDTTYCNGEICGEGRDYDEQGNLVRIFRYDANGDAASVQEISPGSQPRATAKKSRRKS